MSHLRRAFSWIVGPNVFACRRARLWMYEVRAPTGHAGHVLHLWTQLTLQAVSSLSETNSTKRVRLSLFFFYFFFYLSGGLTEDEITNANQGGGLAQWATYSIPTEQVWWCQWRRSSFMFVMECSLLCVCLYVCLWERDWSLFLKNIPPASVRASVKVTTQHLSTALYTIQ